MIFQFCCNRTYPTYTVVESSAMYSPGTGQYYTGNSNSSISYSQVRFLLLLVVLIDLMSQVVVCFSFYHVFDAAIVFGACHLFGAVFCRFIV